MKTPHNDPTHSTDSRHRALLLAFALAAAILSLISTTADNTFPSAYHPDETSKARQVIEGDFNFHHPMLKLTCARLVAVVSGASDSLERVAVSGRWVSALFTAAAIFCLVILAGSLYGATAAAIAGIFLITNHQLFELAHYFKEDPALLFGVSAFFLALSHFDRHPTTGTAALVGAAAGLAISGKYVGILVAPVALALFWIHRPALPLFRSIAVFLAAALGLFLLANLPILLDPTGFVAGFHREVGFALQGHKGITRSVPHGVYGAVFRDATNPIIIVLLVIFAVDLLLRWRTARAADWALVLFPLAFAVVLSFSPKTHHRYFLPATGLLLVIAAAGAARIPSLIEQLRCIWNRFRNASLPTLPRAAQTTLVATATIAAIGVQLPQFLAYYNGFSNDARAAIAEYIRTNVPQTETIIQDKRVNLRALGIPNPIEGKLFAADVASLDELRARGIRYVAVAEGDYGRFFRDNHQPTADGADDFARRRAFYEQLFTEATPVLELPAGTLQYLQPHLKLYLLANSPDSAAGTGSNSSPD